MHVNYPHLSDQSPARPLVASIGQTHYVVDLKLPPEPEAVASALAGLEPVCSFQGIDAFWLRGLAPSSVLLRAIAFERERAARRVGVGRDVAADSDAYDSYYDHLLLIDKQHRIVAASRFAVADDVVSQHGVNALYSCQYFDFGLAASSYMRAGIELSKLFVAAPYQKVRAFDLLLKSFGRVVQTLPRVRFLFGAMPLSKALTEQSLANISAHYSHYHGAYGPIVQALSPYRGYAGSQYFTHFNGTNENRDFRLLRQMLGEGSETNLVLFQRVCQMVEADGIRFEDFGIAHDGRVEAFSVIQLNKLTKASRRLWLSV